MKKIISAVLVLTMMLALLSGCGDNSASENNVETSDLYEQVMARFDGELEEGAVIKVLENDTAVELGYVDQLINAFNEAYKDKGISAERMNIDQYSDLATDGPYGYGPDVWYQANDILMKYADNQHLLPLPIYDMECYEQIPQNAWNAYATDINGETFYCGIPLNVQSGMLYYIESMLPENWETEWDINSNGTPDFFETYTALYAYSELCKEGGEKTKYAGFTIRTARITIKSALRSRNFPLTMMRYAVSLITGSGGILLSRLKAGTDLKVLPSSRSPTRSLRPMSLGTSAGSWSKTVF